MPHHSKPRKMSCRELSIQFCMKLVDVLKMSHSVFKIAQNFDLSSQIVQNNLKKTFFHQNNISQP